MEKEEKLKVEGGAKMKGRRFQQSTSNRKVGFKAQTTGLEDKVFDFGKHKHAADFANSYKEITKYNGVNYKQGGPKMVMAIKDMDKTTICFPEVPEDTTSRADIFI